MILAPVFTGESRAENIERLPFPAGSFGIAEFLAPVNDLDAFRHVN